MLVRSTLWPLQHGVVVCSGNSRWKWKVEWFGIYKYCIHYSTRKKEKNAFDKTTATTLFLIDVRGGHSMEKWAPKNTKHWLRKGVSSTTLCVRGFNMQRWQFLLRNFATFFTLTVDFRIPWTGQVFGGVFVCLFFFFLRPLLILQQSDVKFSHQPVILIT